MHPVNIYQVPIRDQFPFYVPALRSPKYFFGRKSQGSRSLIQGTTIGDCDVPPHNRGHCFLGTPFLLSVAEASLFILVISLLPGSAQPYSAIYTSATDRML